MNKMVSLMLFFISLIYLLFFKAIIMVWLMMELNMFCFVMYVLSLNKFSLKYMSMIFIVQILSSFLILISIVLSLQLKDLFFFCGLVVKLAFFPVIYWYYLLFFLPNFGMFLLLTIQKLFIFSLMSSFLMSKNFLIFLVFSLVVVLMNLSQNLLKFIIIFSSLFHTVWISMSFFMSVNLFFFYLLIYTFTLYFIVNMFLKKTNISSFYINKLNTAFVLLSVVGLPPFIMFLPKLYFIYYLQMFFLILITFLIFTLFNMSLYLRVLFFIFLSMSKFNKMVVSNLKSFFMFFTNFFFIVFY